MPRSRTIRYSTGVWTDDAGKVFLAKEKQSGAIVAIKVIWFRNYIENGIQDQIKNEIEVGKWMDSDGEIQSHLVHNRIVRVYGMFHDEEKRGDGGGISL